MPAMGEEGGDKDPLPSLGGFGVLGIGVHHLPWWGQRSCVAAAPSLGVTWLLSHLPSPVELDILCNR